MASARSRTRSRFSKTEGVAVSRIPAWSATPVFPSLTPGVAASYVLPVSAQGDVITVTWGGPTSKPAWVSFSPPNALPMIYFSGGQTNTVAGVTLIATANGSSIPSTAADISVVVVNPAPSWSAAPSFSGLTQGVTSVQALPVTVSNGATITPSWVGPGTISPTVGATYSWISLQGGTVPTITFTNPPVASVSNVVISALANGQSTSSATVGVGSVTVSAAGNVAPVWSTFGPVTFVAGAASNYSLPVTDDGPLSNLILTSVGASLPAYVTLDSTNRRLVYNGGGSAGTTTTGHQIRANDGVSDYETDWLARSTASGVVWAHDFRSDAEFTNFAKNHSGPTAATLSATPFGGSKAIQSKALGTTFAANASAGQTTFTLTSVSQFPNPASVGSYTLSCGTNSGSGVTEYVTVTAINYGANQMTVSRTASFSYTAGVSTIGKGASSEWRRPFARLPGSQNGRGVDDRGANGTVTMRSWAGYGPTSGLWTYPAGYYGHASYQNSNFDGGEFWIQYRAKIHASRFGSGRLGKFWFLQRVAGSTNRQFFGSIRGASSYDAGRWPPPSGWPYDSDGVDGGTNIHVAHNYGPLVDGTPNGGASSRQINGQYGSTCLSSGGVCLLYPPDEWCTWMIHVIPGQDSVANTTFEYFLHIPGEADYRTVLTTSTHTAAADSDDVEKAWNSFWPVNYMNDYLGSGSVSPAPIDHLIEYTQIIFSKQSIPVPQV